ncbi:MAG: DNA primase [Candidatus Cryptobacteroides sp.]|jgi:DNA primase
MIPQETVQKILDTAKIEEVIGDFVTLKRRGAEYWACCPFHNEKTPSFHIIPAKGMYYCFGCHKGGSAVGFVMDYEHLSYGEALRYLAKKYNIEVIEKEETAEDIANRKRNESLMLVSEYAGKFFQEQLKTDEGRSVGLKYFHARGLEDATIAKYGLGWAPTGRRAFTDAAKSAGYKEEYLLDTGLCSRYEEDGTLRDRFYDRVVFPIHSISGRIIAFGARTLKSDKTIAKYVNSKESDIYVKNLSLYGIWFAKNEIAKRDNCYLVEGYLDVLSMHQLGITNVVASSGTALTEGQIRLIKRFTDNVTIMYDGDSAGIHAALRGIDMFLREGMNVKLVLIPDGDDPDSYSRKHTLAEMEAFLSDNAQDFVDFKATLLMRDAVNDPLKRANVINDIADTIADIPDGVKRATYIDFCSRKFEIRRDVLEERVGATRSKKLAEEKRAEERERERGRRRNLGAASSQGSPSAKAATPDTWTDGLLALEENRIMGKAERGLLNFILTEGTTPMEFQTDSDYYSGDEEDKQTVFEFIDAALEGDQVEFVNAAYRATYQAYSKDYYDGASQEEIVKRLLDAEDRTVAYVAAQLSANERYKLSVENFRESMMSKGSWLTKFVPKAILVFQSCRLESKLAEVREELKKAELVSDADKVHACQVTYAKHLRMLKTIKVRLGREKE